MSHSHILAGLTVETRASALPDSALAAARKMTLDSVACAIGGWDADGVEAMLATLREWGGAPQCATLVHGDRFPPPSAAFANGVLIHALDYDDLYRPAALHLMSSILPTALAGAERSEASGTEFLAAIVLGVEVAARLGLAMRRCWRTPQAAGFLPATIIGGFGATAAAARLLGLTAEQTVSAFGLYYAQAAGNRQALYDKTLTKRMQPAFAARSAIWSAQLAARGVTGPCHAIEGDAGLVALYAAGDGQIDVDELRNGRDRFQIEELAIKRFPSCGACHPTTQAALDLAAEHRFQAGDIHAVDLYLGEGGNEMVGAPFTLGANPQADAQFSAAYGVAVALLRREAGIGRYRDQAIREDVETTELARQIRVLKHLDSPPDRKSFDDDEPFWVDQPHQVRVTLTSGQTLTQVHSIRDVLSPDSRGFDVAAAKLRECCSATGLFSADRAEAIVDAVARLGDAANAQALLALLKGDPCMPRPGSIQ